MWYHFVYWIKPRCVYIALSIWLKMVERELYRFNNPSDGVAFLRKLAKDCRLEEYCWSWSHVWNCRKCYDIWYRYKRLYRYTNFICRNHR